MWGEEGFTWCLCGHRDVQVLSLGSLFGHSILSEHLEAVRGDGVEAADGHLRGVEPFL